MSLLSFFHKCLSLFFRCCLLVPEMMAMKWSSLFFLSLVSSGCRLFSLHADSSVSSLLGLDCRRFILPHISGRSVSLFPPRVWAAGVSYCPILQAGLSTVTGALFMRCCCSIHPLWYPDHHSLWDVGIYFTHSGILVIRSTRCEILVIHFTRYGILVTAPKRKLTMYCTLSKYTHGVLDERGGQRSHAANPQHSLNNNKFG